jgi:hypothetical protein
MAFALPPTSNLVQVGVVHQVDGSELRGLEGV